jgi:S1-C subfamily serine protease
MILAMTGLAPPIAAIAEPRDESLRIYAVHVGGLYGAYLGNGLIITAAHVLNSTQPEVRIAGQTLPAKVIKISPFEQLDLSLLSIDQTKLPMSLQLRRLQLCQGKPVVGAAVVVATPEGTARSQILTPSALPPNLRARFSTVISHVKSTGNSGSAVFDAEKHCLVGIMSRKITQSSPSGESSMDIAKYFVPAFIIRTFIPAEYPF